MEISGKVIAVQPIQTGEGRNGVWKKQEYVIEHDPNSQYPRRMVFNLWGDKIDQYNIQEGQMIRISFDIDCREYNGRWYNDIRAWKVEFEEEASSADAGFEQTQTQTPAPLPTQQASSQFDDKSDLPF